MDKHNINKFKLHITYVRNHFTFDAQQILNTITEDSRPKTLRKCYLAMIDSVYNDNKYKHVHGLKNLGKVDPGFMLISKILSETLEEEFEELNHRYGSYEEYGSLSSFTEDVYKRWEHIIELDSFPTDRFQIMKELLFEVLDYVLSPYFGVLVEKEVLRDDYVDPIIDKKVIPISNFVKQLQWNLNTVKSLIGLIEHKMNSKDFDKATTNSMLRRLFHNTNERNFLVSKLFELHLKLGLEYLENTSFRVVLHETCVNDEFKVEFDKLCKAYNNIHTKKEYLGKELLTIVESLDKLIDLPNFRTFLCVMIED